MTVEDDRAAEYRRTMVARAKNKRAVERALAGDKAARAALDEKTKALLVVDEHGVHRIDAHR